MVVACTSIASASVGSTFRENQSFMPNARMRDYPNLFAQSIHPKSRAQAETNEKRAE
jgi:hypothetical protein